MIFNATGMPEKNLEALKQLSTLLEVIHMYVEVH